MIRDFSGNIHVFLRDTFGENYKMSLVNLSPQSITDSLRFTSLQKGYCLTTSQVKSIYKLRSQLIKEYYSK